MNIWELIIQQPLVNVMIVMSHVLGGSFGLAIIALTIIINLAMLPMTLSQIRNTKAMQDIQPKMADIQKKYARDKQKLSQEQMKIYKEAGIKPAGCAVSLFVQMPIWYALYGAIMLSLAVAPEALLNLSKFLYSWPILYEILPLNNHFLGMDLAQPNFILAILVGVTMWVQQKMTTIPSPDPKQNQQTQMMLWMMPLMFTYIGMMFASGLALYWIVNSVVRIVIQYKMTGWGGLLRQVPHPVAADKKRLKFDVTDEKKSEDKSKADIVISDSDASKLPLLKPNTLKYLPGKDRSQHHPKK